MKKKDINTDQKTSSDRPFRPLTPLEKEGVMIAEFMGLNYETRNYFSGDGFVDENGFDTYSHNSIMTGTYYDGKETSMLVDKMQYHKSWDWLMPVVQKIGDDYYNTPFDETYSKLTEGYENIWTIEDTYKAVVKFIKDQNTIKNN